MSPPSGSLSLHQHTSLQQSASSWYSTRPNHCTLQCTFVLCLIDRRPATLWSHHRHTRQFPLVESPEACSVQTGDNCRSFAEGLGAAISGCRPKTFVWHAVQTTSAVITYSSARCPPVTVCYCWRPNLRCRRCSTMEQSAVCHQTLSRVTLCHVSSEILKLSSSDSPIPLFWFSIFLVAFLSWSLRLLRPR